MRAPLAYGLSVHHFVSQVGDYVGFAAIVAVAIMVLMLFAHARETADLRRRAAESEDEIELLHQQVEWLRNAAAPQVPAAVRPSAAGASPPPVPPPAVVGAQAQADGSGQALPAGVAAGAVAGVRGGSGPLAPAPAQAATAVIRSAVLGAPVGVGAPALSSATKLIPPTDAELETVAAPDAIGVLTPAEHAAARGHGAPSPATAAAQRNGAPPPPAGDLGAGGSTSPRRNYAAAGRPKRRLGPVLLAAAALLIAAIVIVGVFVIGTGGSSGSNQAAANNSVASFGHKQTSNRKPKRGTVAVDPATVTVAVLNGTQTANLAADVSGKLSAKGFKQGATANAADQATATTVVGYMPGAPKAKDDADAVARTLGLKLTAVKQVSSVDQTVACSGTPTNCPDQVIVTVGADLSSDAA